MASSELPTQKVGSENSTNEAVVVFVLGGPGSGKGTQCPKIVEHFGFTNICAGELLQAEVESGSENGEMILKFREEGKIVPSEITMKLLQQAMQQSEKKKFLIDGFPRNEENRTAFENTMKIEPDLVLFFDCPSEVLTKRLLSRNQGRVDDNIYTIQKRLEVYFESTLPVINYYSSKGKVEKIDAQRSIDEVFEDVKGVFSKLKPKSVVGLKNECNILQIGAQVSSII
ncbi:UMP-CMP kinase 3 isoform X2 [Manihot esculenta]|nr:UMP-CMP kinase 3 isoform X2 [Manihot esculenta]XP_021634661.1 UMP-CMP kinase 3 isoform X2 [Manihot esculenta]XP_043806074.1 UMP-CMP kinase 3 isoform X2 [Manihot esculenta]XP_043806075.1 UMP-CMP kinase 3 isoform X2 [Manihot esculenta]